MAISLMYFDECPMHVHIVPELGLPKWFILWRQVKHRAPRNKLKIGCKYLIGLHFNLKHIRENNIDSRKEDLDNLLELVL